MALWKPLTGKGVTTSIALELTDLGIMRWDGDRNCIVAMFGDSFSFGWGQDWRSPVLACYDADLNLLGVPVRGGVATQPARQLWEYGHNNPDYSTVLPCDFIRVGNVWHVAVMLTQGLGHEKMTEFWHSTNLIDWTLTGFGFKHPGTDPCTTMLSFDQFGEYVYIVGTHGLMRDGPIKMWRCRADTFPKGDWQACNNGQPVIQGKYGELCLRNVQGQAVLSFFDSGRYRQSAITVSSPDDLWADGNRIDYVTGQELPQLYGGYIAPGSKLDEPDGMRFAVSQWLTADNSKYHVMVYRDTLPSKGVPAPPDQSYASEVALSENGWPGLPVSADMLEWVRVPGCQPKVTVQVAKGPPSIILRAFVADWNAYIEHVEDATTGGFRAQDSVQNSNHRSGTAVDVNHTKHPFQVSNAGFDQSMIGTMKEMLAFYEGTVFWGQAWGEQGIGPYDAMHIQMGGDTYNNPRTADFIRRKIRADGFSTFRRGDMPAVDVAAVLSEAMGGSLPLDRYRELAPAFSQCLVQADCTTVNRIAMLCAQVGHESAGLRYMHEIADGSAYNGRADLENTQPGDGPRFRGHGPLQVTGRGNHRRCSEWAFSKGLVPSPTYFVDNPEELAGDRFGFIGVIWYWTVARPQLNALADNKDLEGATRAVNGGLNGLADRRARYNACLAMGDKLLGLLADASTATLVKEVKPAMEKGLNWDKSITSQQYYWSCGPATTQILLSIRGINVSEDELVRVVGATVNGTDAISQIELKALDRYCPEAQYTTVWLPNDPPTREQVETFWKHLKISIDHGYGVAQNWVAPPSNTPRPVHGSTDIPGFYKRGSTIYHYIAATGYAEENGQRFVRIGDPGGQPNEYWVTLEQNVSLLTPKGYVWAAAFKEEPVVPVVVSPPVQAPVQAPTPISLPATTLSMEVEWSAFLGDTDAILAVLRAALSSDPAVKQRAVKVLRVVPKDALQTVAQALKG